MRTSNQGGEPRLAARLRDALVEAQCTHTCSLVVLRLLLPRTALSLELDDHAEALVALSQRVRPHVRYADAVVVDLVEGLGVVVCSARPDAARIVAERLRHALAPLGADAHRAGRSRRASHAGSAVSSGQLGPLLRVGLGYATLEDGDSHSCDIAIRAAWKPRILLSLPLAAMSAADTADAERLVPPLDVGDRAATAQTVSEPGGEELAQAPRATGVPHLRLVRLDASEAAREKESEALRERARALGVPFVRLPPRLPMSARRAFSAELARELRAVAIGRTRDTLTVAMDDPADINAVLRLRSATGLAIFPVLAAAKEIEQALGQPR
jgi:MshEN domain